MIHELFGDLIHKDDHLSDGQMLARSVIAFILIIALVHLAGRRSFGLHSPFDTVISLLLGSTLSRGIVGASSFTGVLGACIILAILHRCLAYLSLHNPSISRLVSGQTKVLYKDGQFSQDTMNAMLISERDVQEAVRLNGNKETLDQIKSVYLERNGKISIIKKE